MSIRTRASAALVRKTRTTICPPARLPAAARAGVRGCASPPAWHRASRLHTSAVLATASADAPLTMHPTARQGFDLSGASGLYDRARPGYPDEALDAILDAPTPRAGEEAQRVVELGSGTGISTRALLARAGARGTPLASLDAFEPSEGMRTAWDETTAAALATPALGHSVASSGHVRCHPGTFESFASAVGEGQADLVLVAQAWHWAPDFDAALAETARALRPGGALALLWNLEDRDGARWVARLRDMYEAHEQGVPQYHRGAWHAMYAAESMHKFDLHEPLHFAWAIPTTRQSVKDRVFSKSYISVLPPRQKYVVGTFMDHLLDEPDAELDRRWIDKQKGLFEYPHGTDVFLFTKK